MKPTGILRAFAGLAALALVIGPAAPGLRAEFECKQELMAGTWIGYGNLHGQGVFEVGDYWSVVGRYVYDERGYATTAGQTNTQSGAPNGIVAGSFLPNFETRITINSDCTGRFTYHNAIPGHPNYGKLIWAGDVVCGNGQKECFATFTETPPPGNTDPIGIIGVFTWRKIEPDDQGLSQRLHVMEAKINALMRRQGLNPGAFDNAQ